MVDNCDLERYLGDVIADGYGFGRPIEVRSVQATRNHTLAVVAKDARYALRIRGDAWWIDDESELNFELDLLDHLAADGLSVSTAVPQRNGDRIGVAVRPLNPSEHDMLLTMARLAWIREGCRSPNLAPMLHDPFIRYAQDDCGRWQMKPPV